MAQMAVSAIGRPLLGCYCEEGLGFRLQRHVIFWSFAKGFGVPLGLKGGLEFKGATSPQGVS